MTTAETHASLSSRSAAILFSVALLVGLGIRLVYFGGLASIDDFNYLRHAAEVWQGRFVLEDVSYWHGMRPLVFVPISWIFAAFGVSEATATLWPLAASLLTIFVISRIATRLGGRDVGVAAAFAAAVFPMAVEESTRVLPGPFINLLIALSSYFFLRGLDAKPGRGVNFALSGLLAASMPWAGHLGLVFAVFFPVAAVVHGRGLTVRSYWPFAAGVTCVAVFTLFSQWAIAGDPLASLAVARKVLVSEQATPRPLFYLSLLAYPFRSHGGVFYLAAVGAVFAIVRRRRGALLVFAWLLFMYLILEFGSSSVVAYRPLFKQARYISALYVPGVVLAGFGAIAMIRWVARRRVPALTMGAVTMLVVGLGAGSIFTLERNTAWRNDERVRLLEIRDAIVATAARDEVVYVSHWLWNTRAAFYIGYLPEYATSGYTPYHAVNLNRVSTTSKIRYVQSLEAGDAMAPGILLDDVGLYRLSVGERQISLVDEGEIPPVLDHPPASWTLVDSVRVNRISTVAILRIPEGAVWPGDNPAW